MTRLKFLAPLVLGLTLVVGGGRSHSSGCAMT